jgi:hypothetical protein
MLMNLMTVICDRRSIVLQIRVSNLHFRVTYANDLDSIEVLSLKSLICNAKSKELILRLIRAFSFRY